MLQPFRFDLVDRWQGRPVELTFDPTVSVETLEMVEARWRPEQRRLKGEALARGVPVAPFPSYQQVR
jgi:hypothetical protein